MTHMTQKGKEGDNRRSFRSLQISGRDNRPSRDSRFSSFRAERGGSGFAILSLCFKGWGKGGAVVVKKDQGLVKLTVRF